MRALFALHFKPMGLAWRNIDEILIFGVALNFSPKIPFHATGLHSNSDVETRAPWRHGHADTIIISNAHLRFSGDYNRFGGAIAIGLNRLDAIDPAFGDRSKAVT